MKSYGLAEGVLLGELARQVNGGLIDLEEKLGDTPCLVFNPFSNDEKPLITGRNLASNILKLSETDSTVSFDLIHHGYLAREAVVAPLWKSNRNSLASSLIVGRSNTCDIRVNSGKASKVHAWIRQQRNFRESRWEITDNYSTNGTFIDGVLLDPARPYPLHSEHEIVFGTVHCIFLNRQSLFDLCDLFEHESVDASETHLTMGPSHV
jgi:hypothetical protein